MQIKRYILTSHNDGAGDSLCAKCFNTHADAFICMINEAMGIIADNGDVKDMFELEHEIDSSGLWFEFEGVMYEWSITGSYIKLDANERRLAHYELEEENILADIDSVIFNFEKGYVLSDADKKAIKSRFTSKHDWTLPDDIQLLCYIDERLDEEILPTRFKIGFDEDDETEFEATSLKELDSLWKDFCKENNLDFSCIDYCKPVEIVA